MSPVRAMVNEANSEGDVGPSSHRVPKLQIVTVERLFDRHPIDLPANDRVRHRLLVMRGIPVRHQVSRKSDVTERTLEIVHDGLGEASH